MDNKRRCKWCNLKNPLYVAYHDTEWCAPHFEDQYLYEMLILESFQAGLSWECVLNKRESFRKAYDHFNLTRVSSYTEMDVERLMQDANIIRHRRKIQASIQNSKVFQSIVSEYGTFYGYLCTFTKGQIFRETNRTTNDLSDAISKDLRKRGMTFVGSTTIYSYLQAVGILYSHDPDCFLHK